MKYDNISMDGRIGFFKKGHKYIDTHSNRRYNSVTGLLKTYKEPFDTEAIASRLVADPTSKYFELSWEEVAEEWRLKGKKAADEGTLLHSYGEDLFNGITTTPPDLPKAAHVPLVIEDLFSKGYTLAKTEILLYSEELKLAGQSDILLKRGKDFMIYDFKFLSKPLQKKSYYNSNKGGYLKMAGPFKHLNDCNWIHYSIQLAIYQTLTGEPERVKEKVLIVITDGGYKYVPAYPMRVYWNSLNELHAIYEIWNGKWYSSETAKLTKTKPKWIKGI